MGGSLSVLNLTSTTAEVLVNDVVGDKIEEY